MANPIKLYESRTILIKKETTYGVDPTPVVGTDALLSFEGSIKVQADKLERNQDLAYFTANPFVLVGKRAIIEFDFDLLGNASAGLAAPCAPVLRACSHAETLVASTSATYNPITNTPDSVAVYFFHAGIKFVVLGCRGSLKIDGELKNFCKVHCTLTGIILVAGITETAPGAVVLTAFRSPVPMTTETVMLVIGGVTLNAVKFSLDQGQTLNMFEGSETREVAVTDRKVTGSFSIFQEVLATFNPFSLADNLTNQTAVFTIDGGATKKLVMNMPKLQLEYASLSNMDQGMVYDIPFIALPSSGSDEYNIAFT